jgi:hypothetical protein
MAYFKDNKGHTIILNKYPYDTIILNCSYCKKNKVFDKVYL